MLKTPDTKDKITGAWAVCLCEIIDFLNTYLMSEKILKVSCGALEIFLHFSSCINLSADTEISFLENNIIMNYQVITEFLSNDQ